MAPARSPIDDVADFYSVRAGYPLGRLEPGEVVVCGLDRRMGSAMLWICVLGDRGQVSTRHELAESARVSVERLSGPEALLGDECTSSMLRLCEDAAGPGVALRGGHGVKLYCPAERYVRIEDPAVQQITRETAPEVIRQLRQDDGIPDEVDYLLADNAAFACYAGGMAVGFSGTHPVGEFSDRIGNTMIGLMAPYRRRGYGKALASATAGELIRQGRTPVWGTGADNVPAIRTAHSVGYEVYCRIFEVRVA